MSSCVGILIVCGSKNSIHAEVLWSQFSDGPTIFIQDIVYNIFQIISLQYDCNIVQPWTNLAVAVHV